MMVGACRRDAAGKKGEPGMKNVEMTVAGNILTIKVDLSKEFGPSSSKRSIIIASAEGNVGRRRWGLMFTARNKLEDWR